MVARGFSRLDMSKLRPNIIEKRLGDIFSVDFVDTLDLDSKLTVADSMRDLMVLAENYVRSNAAVGCKSVHAVSGKQDVDVEKYGAQALVNVEHAKSVFQSLGADDTPCYASVKDVQLCYAAAVGVEGVVGVQVQKGSGCLGNRLVDDGDVSQYSTLRFLTAYAQCMESSVPKPGTYDCACVHVYPALFGCQVMDRAVGKVGLGLADDPGISYEVFSGGLSQRHDATMCQRRFASEIDAGFRTTAEALVRVVPARYDRWLHEKELCCTARCGCWSFGVREVRGVGWLVARQFWCSDGKVSGVTEGARTVLGMVGLSRITDSSGCWYEFDYLAVDRWLRSASLDDFLRFGFGCGNGCGVVLVKMLMLWFEMIGTAAISLADVVRVCRRDLASVVLGSDDGYEWESCGGLDIAKAYLCSCGRNH